MITLQLVAANLSERRAEISIVAAATWLTDERMPRGPLLMPTLATLGTSRAAARATDLDQARLWLKRAARLDAQARSAPRPGAVENVGEIAQNVAPRGQANTGTDGDRIQAGARSASGLCLAEAGGRSRTRPERHRRGRDPGPA